MTAQSKRGTSMLEGALEKRQKQTLARINTLYKTLVILVAVAVMLVMFQLATNRVKQPKTHEQQQIQLFSEILLKRPKDPMARSKIAVIHLRAKRYGQAISQLQTVLKDFPDYVPAAYYLGIAYSKQGDSGQAEKQLLKTLSMIKNAKGKVMPAYRLAEIYKQQGKTEQARKYYSLVVAGEPILWNPHFELGRIYQEEGKFRVALEHYLAAAKFNPSPKIKKAIKEVERKAGGND